MAPGKIINKAMGKTTAEHLANVAYLANLQMIRVNDFQIIQEFKAGPSTVNTTSETIKLDAFRPGWVYVITHIGGINVTDSGGQIRLGYIDGTTKVILESSTYSAAGDSVEYVGQLMLKEGDQIFGEFRGAGASDVLQLNLNGYKIRR